jgi:hypothetical protein
MRRLSLYFFAATLALQLIPLGLAQQASVTTVPNLIRYGGTLKDAQGAPLSSSTVGITFAIYKQQDGGAPIWMETQNMTTDAGGNYSALLGSTTATGLPNDLFSQQEQRWLGVQVEGQAEQPRVLMVSVPYAFKAHEAETLGGKSPSDFVLANNATSAVNSGSGGPAVSSTGNNPPGGNGARQGAASDGPTNFSGSTTDQIVGVTQSGTGYGIAATADSKAIVGTATDPSATAYGVQGVATGTAGVGLIGTASSTTGFTYGLRGTSSSMSGTGVRGIDVATSGNTTGVSGYVESSAGTAGVFNNGAGGSILVGQNNGATKFTVDGSGNVNISGNFTGSGTGITGLQFSQLTGQLGSSQFTGTYSNAVTLSNTGNMFSGTSFTGGTFTGSGSGLTGVPAGMLSGTLASAQFSGTYSNAVMLTNTSNMFYGNGANLTGVPVGSGSSFYIQNGTSAQHASFNITGTGTLSGALAANAGVSAMLTTGTGSAVSGTATVTSGTVYGVSGQTASPGGTGVYGTNTATSGSAYGVAGYTASTAFNASGVYGQASASTGSTNGVFGLTNSSGNSDGVFGEAASTTGGAIGVVGATYGLNGVGVRGNAFSTDSSGNAVGVEGVSANPNGTGVWGVANSTSGTTYGVYGQTASPSGYGVYGNATATSGTAYGLYGTSASPSGYGVYGVSTSTTGLGYGVVGQGGINDGVYGTTSGAEAAGVVAYNTNTTSYEAQAIYAVAYSANASAGFFRNIGGGWAIIGANASDNIFTVDSEGDGYFAGDLNVGGTLSKGGGSFKIDDPIDPANRTLSHSFVESPDMMNIYNGNVTTDNRGLATVVLPNYFEALNRDFRYQLTVIGQFAQAMIAKEIDRGRFTIKTNKPGVKVSWQVTGIRQDAWANAHRIPNEEDKPQEQRGTYLHPDLFGAAGDKNTNAMLRR